MTNPDHVQPPAWTSAATRAAWRRTMLWGVAWLIVGLGCLAGFVAYTSAVDARTQDLIDNGEQVTATVLEDPSTAVRCGQVVVSVRFELEGQEYTEPFSVDGCGNNLNKNQRVQLFVNPDDPTDFVSKSDSNESGGAVLAAIAALLLGTLLSIAGPVRLVRGLLTRRTLQRFPWTERPARSVYVTTKISRDRPVLVLTDTDPATMLALRWPASGTSGLDVGLMLVAGFGSSWPVAAASPSSPVRTVRAAAPRLAKRAQEAVERPAEQPAPA